MYFKVVKMVGFTIGRQRLISLCTRHRDVPMLVSAAALLLAVLVRFQTPYLALGNVGPLLRSGLPCTVSHLPD